MTHFFSVPIPIPLLVLFFYFFNVLTPSQFIIYSYPKVFCFVVKFQWFSINIYIKCSWSWLEVDFLHVDKHQSSLQVDCNTLGIKIFYKVILSLLMGMFSILKVYTQSKTFAISLQYLKNKVRNGVHFLNADKHQNFSKLALSFSMEVATHAQSTQNRKF